MNGRLLIRRGWVLKDNGLLNATLGEVDAPVYKTQRIYQKPMDSRATVP